MKKIMLLMTILLITGCAKSDLSKAYKNMNVKEIESYSVDLRTSGNYNDEKVRGAYRISNYKDEQTIIRYTESNKGSKRINYEYVYENNELFRLNENDYEKTNDKFQYLNINLSLDGLKEVKKVTEEKEVKEGEITYQVYEVVFKDKFINKLFKEYGYDIDAKDATGTIYLNEGKVNRIIYKTEDLTFNLLYFGIGTVREIELN